MGLGEEVLDTVEEESKSEIKEEVLLYAEKSGELSKDDGGR